MDLFQQRQLCDYTVVVVVLFVTILTQRNVQPVRHVSGNERMHARGAAHHTEPRCHGDGTDPDQQCWSSRHRDVSSSGKLLTG